MACLPLFFCVRALSLWLCSAWLAQLVTEGFLTRKGKGYQLSAAAAQAEDEHRGKRSRTTTNAAMEIDDGVGDEDLAGDAASAAASEGAGSSPEGSAPSSHAVLLASADQALSQLRDEPELDADGRRRGADSNDGLIPTPTQPKQPQPLPFRQVDIDELEEEEDDDAAQ